MKKNYINKFFTILGFLLLAFLAINMNACSKEKSNNNQNPNQFGYGYGPGVGGGHLGNGIGYSGDGSMVLQLTIAGQNGGQAGATGTLFVQGHSMGCALAPGNYTLQTVQPGIYYNGDFYPPQGDGFTLRANNGMEIYVEGYLTNQQDQYGNRVMFAQANIPGCPTTFN